jgi:hypothetical protein
MSKSAAFLRAPKLFVFPSEIAIEVDGLPAEAARPHVRPSFALRASKGSLRCCAAQAGGARRDRTDDLMLAKHALSQLSYGPDRIMYARQPAKKWWAREDLNFRPHAYQARALTN